MFTATPQSVKFLFLVIYSASANFCTANLKSTTYLLRTAESRSHLLRQKSLNHATHNEGQYTQLHT